MRLDNETSQAFSTHPELGMGIQLGAEEKGRYILVIGSVVAFRFDESLIEKVENLDEIPWASKEGNRDEQEGAFKSWLSGLPEAPPITPVATTIAHHLLQVVLLGPATPLAPPSPPPPIIYGHLPFTATTGPSDVFYRYEPFPTSRRINRATGSIAPGTYAAPELEEPFMPTGFSAVARCALPSLFPARWKWKISPVPTTIRCGASVPLYGQSGGGVEVMFPTGATNAGTVPYPVMLPIL